MDGKEKKKFFHSILANLEKFTDQIKKSAFPRILIAKIKFKRYSLVQHYYYHAYINNNVKQINKQIKFQNVKLQIKKSFRWFLQKKTSN